MKTAFKKKLSIKYFVFLLLLTIAQQGFSQPQVVVQAGIGAPPLWAPAYGNVNQVQYYYLPDLEVYYDVWNHEYVYLEDGNWLFSPILPPIYGNYDLYGGHVVVLDYRVHQPWMHHELYVAHYPRYYHHSVYARNQGEYSTGFDENTNQHYYGPRINSASNGLPSPNNEGHERSFSETNHANQPELRRQAAHYQERVVGQRVKVQGNMTRPKNTENTGRRR